MNEGRNELRFSFLGDDSVCHICVYLYSRMHYTRYTHDCYCYLNIHMYIICMLLWWTWSVWLHCVVLDVWRMTSHQFQWSCCILNCIINWSRLGLLIKCGTEKKNCNGRSGTHWKPIRQVFHSSKLNLEKDAWDMARKAIKWKWIYSLLNVHLFGRNSRCPLNNFGFWNWCELISCEMWYPTSFWLYCKSRKTLTSKLKQTQQKKKKTIFQLLCLARFISCSLLSPDYYYGELCFWCHNSQTNIDNRMFFYSWQMCWHAIYKLLLPLRTVYVSLICSYSVFQVASHIRFLGKSL